MTQVENMDIANLRKDLAAGRFEFSRHAFHRAVERNISADEIRQAGAVVEVIEDYPRDKYLPSCLLLGFTSGGRPLHLQVCYIEAELVKIITLYEPNPGQWEEYRRRRTS
ncbi:MAG: DUF4258 domain-containing protein [Kiritimatiellaeota bacterium]|nr:DUF4258 domain-containing protein [Kiritimatiellota bacterium]